MTAALDRSLGVLRRGYPYLLELRRRAGTETVQIRLLGRRTTVLSGTAGARLFYDEDVMRRKGAIPRPLRRTLFGDGAVHGLDDADHKHRKAMFVAMLDSEAARGVAALADARWRAPTIDRATDPVGVFGEAVSVHCAAICEWAGVPVDVVDDALARDLIAMVDGFGSIGPRQVLARRARHRANRWARRLVLQVRGGHRNIPPESAVATIAGHRDRNGRPLPAKVAAVEVLNVLRPTVAVAYFVAFTACALARQPQLRTMLEHTDDATYEAFAHEVRRVYPFVPMLAAKVRRPVTHQGHRLPRGRRVVLDVYGMLHEPDVWPAPETFDVDRFRGVEPDPYRYLPQGGGDARTGHRCPGERLTVELIKTAVRFLVDRPAPATAGEHRIPLNRMPTRPLG